MNRRKKPLGSAKKHKALHEYMTPNFWRAHYFLPAVVALMSIGMALGMAHFSALKPQSALALGSDNVRGWAWAPTVGWFSMNDQKPNCSPSGPACSSGGSYGVNMDTVPTIQYDGTLGHTITGFAWSDNVGFVCFGDSCNIAACGALAPANPGYFYAYAEKITGTNAVDVHGWAGICSLKEAGWVALNCKDPVANSCPGLPTDKKFRMAYNPSDNKYYSAIYNGNPAINEGVSFGWNGNADGTGIGYMSFYPAGADGAYLHIATEDDPLCSDSLDNDLNGKTDCADAPCNTRLVCTTSELNWLGGGLTQQYTACHNAVDDNGLNGKDCATDTSCQPADVCKGEPAFLNGCLDGIDNNGDNTADCTDNSVPGLLADPTCAADPSCAPPTPPQSQCLAFAADPDQKNKCCSDNDTNGPYSLDCLDSDCQTNAGVCSAWTKVEAGNVYAGGGIVGTKAPGQAGINNAQYCLRANNPAQPIEWTSQFAQCTESDVGEIKLPTYGQGYRNALGSIDLDGIRNGRYGTVVTIPHGAVYTLPQNLNGQVFRYIGMGVGDKLTLNGVTFKNGTGTTGKGSGLLLVDNADLEITGNIGYDTAMVQTRLRNLASFGAIVVQDEFGNGGDMTIASPVEKISGAYFVEGTVKTGTTGSAATDKYLKLFGIYVANRFNLQRLINTDPTQSAEQFIFDGRAVVNPPPGMQDVGKSLPRPSDAY